MTPVSYSVFLLSISTSQISTQFCHFCGAKFSASTCKRTAMPLTFCHPFAVLPLRRFCPVSLNFPALIVGSMSPDFGYYIGYFPMATFAHSIQGTFIFCVPIGILALCIAYTLWRPLCFTLPQPHREALLTLTLMQPPRLSLRSALMAAISILLGAWTHTIWDSFTHSTGWAVQHISILQTPLIKLGNTTLHASYVLQQISTFIGGAVLVAMYVSWLSRQPVIATNQNFSAERVRYWAISIMAILAIALAVPMAAEMTSQFDGYMALRVFVFRSCVYSATIFATVYTATAITAYFIHHKKQQA